MFELKEEYRNTVKWIHADIRRYNFKGPYHLVCCRNLVATYFSNNLQQRIFRKIRDAMPAGSALVLGTHEMLPEEVEGFEKDNKVKQVYWAV